MPPVAGVAFPLTAVLTAPRVGAEDLAADRDGEEDLAAGRLLRDGDFAAVEGFAFLRADGVFFCPVSLAMQPLKESTRLRWDRAGTMRTPRGNAVRVGQDTVTEGVLNGKRNSHIGRYT